MRAALIQLCVDGRHTSADRWSRVEQLLAALEGNAVELVILPELWGVGFSNDAGYSQAEEPLHGATTARLAQWAQRLHCHILTGSFIERARDGRYNTMALLDENGTLLGQYRKIHLFGYASRERELLSAGTSTSEIKTSYGVFGLATCYDLRFPEQFRRMVDNGAALFAISAAWPQERLEDWRLFCRVRAVENQSFLLACNHVGQIGSSVGAGHSMVVGPDGKILAEAGAQEQVLLADVDMHDVQRFRKQFPALHDRVTL